MKPLLKAVAVSALSVGLLGGAAIAQEHRDDQEHHDQYVRHDDWKKGQHLKHEDWDRGRHMDDWRAHHLRRPPSGYEWRDVDGHYVMANHEGVIFQVVIHH